MATPGIRTFITTRMPGIHIHIIPHPQTTGTVGIGLTAASIGTIISTASKPDQRF
jgi:ATP-dependent protease ClpP protease subunit